MKNIVFLGCENSHARQFLSYIKEDEKYKDINPLGCFSMFDKDAQNKLASDFNIVSMKQADEFVGSVDGVVINARHGGYHLSLLKPYLKKGLTAYIDKPVTISEEDAIELAKLGKQYDLKLVGGTSLILHPYVQELKQLRENSTCFGGLVRAYISMDNPHGGYYFYAEHLVGMLLEVFGFYPISAYATEFENQICFSINYDKYQVSGIFGKCNDFYSVEVHTEKGQEFRRIPVTGGEKYFKDHFDEFVEVMSKNDNLTDYNKFIASVFVMNAIERSFKNNKVEKINCYKI